MVFALVGKTFKEANMLPFMLPARAKHVLEPEQFRSCCKIIPLVGLNMNRVIVMNVKLEQNKSITKQNDAS